jgi:hypothetical protein
MKSKPPPASSFLFLTSGILTAIMIALAVVLLGASALSGLARPDGSVGILIAIGLAVFFGAATIVGWAVTQEDN